MSKFKIKKSLLPSWHNEYTLNDEEIDVNDIFIGIHHSADPDSYSQATNTTSDKFYDNEDQDFDFDQYFSISQSDIEQNYPWLETINAYNIGDQRVGIVKDSAICFFNSTQITDTDEELYSGRRALSEDNSHYKFRWNNDSKVIEMAQGTSNDSWRTINNNFHSPIIHLKLWGGGGGGGGGKGIFLGDNPGGGGGGGSGIATCIINLEQLGTLHIYVGKGGNGGAGGGGNGQSGTNSFAKEFNSSTNLITCNGGGGGTGGVDSDTGGSGGSGGTVVCDTPVILDDTSGKFKFKLLASSTGGAGGNATTGNNTGNQGGSIADKYANLSPVNTSQIQIAGKQGGKPRDACAQGGGGSSYGFGSSGSNSTSSSISGGLGAGGGGGWYSGGNNAGDIPGTSGGDGGFNILSIKAT